MLRQFANANGLRLGPDIPEWDMVFNPHDNVRVDFARRIINTFEPTEYMRAPEKKITNCPPVIFKIISHVLSKDVDTIEHFMNWLAYIAQERERTMTAWIWHGTQGTGKGILMNKVLKPLFGETQTVIKRAAELSEKWTDFVAGKFIVFIDEIQTSAFKDEAGIIANMKNFITEPTVTVRMMNRNSYAVQNFTSWIFASNKPDPASVDKEDRRFNVAPYQPIALEISQEEIDKIPSELQDFYNYLANFAVDKLLACTVLKSSARNTLIELSQTTSETAASAIREGNLGFFIDQLPTDDSYKLNQLALNKVEEYRRVLFNIINRAKSNGACNILRDELYTMFNYTVGGMSPSPGVFTRFLGHKQISIKNVFVGKAQKGIQAQWTDIQEFSNYIKDNFPDLKVKA